MAWAGWKQIIRCLFGLLALFARAFGVSFGFVSFVLVGLVDTLVLGETIWLILWFWVKPFGSFAVQRHSFASSVHSFASFDPFAISFASFDPFALPFGVVVVSFDCFVFPC